jgi:hypothetical protein
MMPTGLFSQIALVVLSLGIIFTYVKPAFDEIKTKQDTIASYQTEYAKVSDVSAQLSTVSAKLNTVSSDDKRRLLTYMPDQVDTVGVPRDIKAIADRSGILLKQVAYDGPEQSAEEAAYTDPAVAAPTTNPLFDSEAHTFEVEFESTYEQLKSFVTDLERNAYPLEVHELVAKELDGGFLEVLMKVVTYDRISPGPTELTEEQPS